jgi:hypothetical protein
MINMQSDPASVLPASYAVLDMLFVLRHCERGIGGGLRCSRKLNSSKLSSLPLTKHFQPLPCRQAPARDCNGPHLTSELLIALRNYKLGTQVKMKLQKIHSNRQQRGKKAVSYISLRVFVTGRTLHAAPDCHSRISFRMALFGYRRRDSRRAFVVGLVLCSDSQVVMLSRSYVQPSLAITGSAISSSVIGHLNSFGKVDLDLCKVLRRRAPCSSSGMPQARMAIRNSHFNIFATGPGPRGDQDGEAPCCAPR